MPAVMISDLVRSVDLLAVNLEEAAAGVGLTGCNSPASQVVECFVACIRKRSPSTFLSVTAGGDGSWGWDGAALTHSPALCVPVASTAGAGDAQLAGIIAGVAAELSLREAQVLGTLLAALSVTSPHSIHPAAARSALRSLAIESKVPVSGRLFSLLED
jgi:sugar/nucleoside kinase (ribokinase family)